MSFAGSSAGNVSATPMSDVPATLDQIFQDITTSNDQKVLHERLKHFTPKDARDAILASTLSSGQDPLSVLDPERNTIGCLYIL